MPDCPVPFNVGLMEAVMPGVEQIQAKMQMLLDFWFLFLMAAESPAHQST